MDPPADKAAAVAETNDLPADELAAAALSNEPAEDDAAAFYYPTGELSVVLPGQSVPRTIV